MFKSKVYLVGAGPGDPYLITVKALELIKTADCIIYDNLVNTGLLKFRKDGAKLIYAGKRAGNHSLTQDKINQLLLSMAKIHKRVVRLKGGDPFIFGRGAEEALYLSKRNINFEIVPGVTSAIAAPAYAGIPLTERNRVSSVAFITGHEDPAKAHSSIKWEALASLGTLVFLMGIGNLGLIVRKLVSCGKPKATPVAIIRSGTTAAQKTVIGTLGDIKELAEKNKITPPAVIVVGEVVKLRKALTWFEEKPLFGKRVIVTRAAPQAGVFSGQLAELGFEVVEIPVIKIVPLDADNQLSDALLRSRYDWIIFTSVNGVDEFIEFLKRAGKDSRIFSGVKICCIGPQTAGRLTEIGIKPDYIPMRFCAEAIIGHFAKPEFKGSSILILRAKQAQDILPQGLRQLGLAVKVIDLYDTRIDKDSVFKVKEELERDADLITFTSSSTVRNFIKLAGRDYLRKLSRIKLASIGPVTSRTLRDFGLKPDIEATAFTTNGLVEAISKNYL